MTFLTISYLLWSQTAFIDTIFSQIEPRASTCFLYYLVLEGGLYSKEASICCNFLSVICHMALFRNFFHKSGYNVKMSYFCNIKSLVNFGKDHNQAKYCVISFYHLISKFGLYVRSKPWFIFEDGVY